jgi:hypothetical protein
MPTSTIGVQRNLKPLGITAIERHVLIDTTIVCIGFSMIVYISGFMCHVGIIRKKQ